MGTDIATLTDRSSITRLAESMQGMPEESKVDCPVRHWHADHVYCREIFIPAGTVIVGKIHKHAHTNIISKGRLVMATEFDDPVEVRAPFTFISTAGTQRVVWAQEDTIWTTVHHNPEGTEDLDALERRVIAKTHAELDEFLTAKVLGAV